MIVHTSLNLKNKTKVYMVHTYICQFLRYDAMPILFQQSIAYWNISAHLSYNL